jgi:hypothetical protein
MKPSERRQQMKEEMAQRHQESYNSKDDSGRFKSVLIKENLGNTPMWKCSEDEHFINIIPFIAGVNHPKVAPGKWAYFLDYFLHRKVGVNEDNYVCMARTYNKPCPICNHQAELRKGDSYDEDFVKSLNPTRRALYNIECLDSDKEIKKGIQLFDVSHYLFEKELAEKAKKPRGGGFTLFSNAEEGKIVFFRKSGSGATNTEYKAFDFMDREEIISDELLDNALCLDELLHIPTFEEVEAAFFGSTGGTDEVSEQAKEEGKVEAEEERRRPATRRSTPEEKPAEEPTTNTTSAEDFSCPGDPETDFNTFEVCDVCPDFADCEVEYNAAVAKAEAEEAAKKAAEAEAVTKAETTAATPARRVRPGAAASAAESAPTTTAATTEEPTRRVRRRPGQ